MARILVVDDEAQVRELLRKTLGTEGHEVVTAEDGETGLEAATSRDIDLVITDLIMPNKGGIVFIKELRAQRPTMPVLAISGGGRTGRFNFLPVAQTFSSVWSLKKPFRSSQLLAMVRDALAGSLAPGTEEVEALGGL